MTRIAGKCEIKYLVAGVGWASAELIMTKYIFLDDQLNAIRRIFILFYFKDSILCGLVQEVLSSIGNMFK